MGHGMSCEGQIEIFFSKCVTLEGNSLVNLSVLSVQFGLLINIYSVFK